MYDNNWCVFIKVIKISHSYPIAGHLTTKNSFMNYFIFKQLKKNFNMSDIEL